MAFSYRSSSFSNYLSVALLILVNLIPAVGVLLFGWEVFDVIFIYVMETIIIGLMNILKMAFSTVLEGKSAESPMMVHGLKLFLIPFFTVHYFFFVVIQTIFVFFLMNQTSQPELIPDLIWSICSEQTPIRLALLGLVISHLFSFQINYIGKREYARTGLLRLMMLPYVRIFIQQFVVIIGAFLIMLFNTPNVFVLLLVILKIIADVFMHLKMHRVSSQAI
jgi:hypothetical protein